MTKNRGNGSYPYAIIVGIDRDPGLQAARILTARSVPVIGIAIDADHYCCRTNVCDEIHFVDTYDEITGLLETIGPRLDQKAVLFPCSDPYVRLISRQRQRLDHWYHIALPAPDVVEMLMDKTRFYTYAQEKGFPIPKTMFLHNKADAEQAAKSFVFPCILKPSHRSDEWSSQTSLKAIKMSDPQEFLALYDRCRHWIDTLIIQEWIEGGDANLYSCNCYFDANSEPLATFIARKLRQWPPGAGDSSLGEECRNDIVLQETIRLFRSVGYYGLGYVEMKQDQRTGKHFFVEPNIGRPTGRSSIAEAGGVELLYTMYCDVLGLPLPAQREQKYSGVKWIQIRKDLQSAFYYWRKGELSLRAWWQSWRGPKTYALLSWRDPAPFLVDLLKAAQKGLSLYKRKKSSGTSANRATDRPAILNDTSLR